jgi:hypothetical protein
LTGIVTSLRGGQSSSGGGGSDSHYDGFVKCCDKKLDVVFRAEDILNLKSKTDDNGDHDGGDTQTESSGASSGEGRGRQPPQAQAQQLLALAVGAEVSFDYVPPERG